MHVTKELSASLDYFRLMFVFLCVIPVTLALIARASRAPSLFPSANSCVIF
jgi:hypothetical protein